MKVKYLKLKHWLLVSLGGLLGISMTGCEEIPLACEYGCPEGYYRVRGQVTNTKGEPIEGIEVASAYETADGYVMTDYEGLGTTGPDGRYDVRVHGMPGFAAHLGFRDIDGEQNGAYDDTVVSVSAPQSAFHGGDGNWNYGTAEITQDVTLTPAEE